MFHEPTRRAHPLPFFSVKPKSFPIFKVNAFHSICIKANGISLAKLGRELKETMAIDGWDFLPMPFNGSHSKSLTRTRYQAIAKSPLRKAAMWASLELNYVCSIWMTQALSMIRWEISCEPLHMQRNWESKSLWMYPTSWVSDVKLKYTIKAECYWLWSPTTLPFL